jgi:hypothetical protein
LFGAVEAGHAPGDVAPAEVGDQDDGEQRDAADDTDRPGILCGLSLNIGGIDTGVDSDRGAGGNQQGAEDGCGTGGGQPAEKGRTPLDTAVAILFAGHHGLPIRPYRIGSAAPHRPVGRLSAALPVGVGPLRRT